ncbi:hypothetical protein DRQ53_11710 [bacterium]|nr:MAG: hypothetical protein DRQ53_11710 [bacterium]
MVPVSASFRRHKIVAAICLILLPAMIGFSPRAQADQEYSGSTNYLRAAYQAGQVVQTNGFLRGDNLSGEPIESFQSVRLEFGWQTDGSKGWHHEYNFPTFGIGLYGADYNSDELGTPTSLYGYFTWPIKRTQRWKFNFDLAFGLTNDWEPYDPVNNPKNTAMGLGRSVHIEAGASAEYRLASRWSVIGGITGTHFSNGGTQRPNHGLNQLGPILFLKYDVDDPAATPDVRRDIKSPKEWNIAVTGSAGIRNLDLKFEDPDLREEFGNQSYTILNLTTVAGYHLTYKSRVVFGLDVAYDETVGDLIKVDGINRGVNAEGETIDNFELGVVGGYEVSAHRTHILVHFAYKVLSKEVPGRLPKFYQRLGVRQFVYRNWYAGLNVRFHEIGSADNLEWNLGYKVSL